MKFIFLFLLFSLLLSTAMKAQSFKALSRQIRREWGEKPHSSYEARRKLYKDNRLPFIFSRDTSYILKSFDIESGISHCKIWNTAGGVDYEYFKRQIKIDSQSYFTKFIVTTVQQWDTVRLRVEEKRFLDTNPERWVRAMRIVFKKDRTFEIATIDFKYFFDLHRDSIY